MKKLKKKHIIFTIIVIMLIGVGIFVGVTKVGYEMTVRFRGYTEVGNNIYMDKNFTGDIQKTLEIIEEANIRLEKFWGNVKSKPIIIISSDEDKLKKMGWTGNPALTNTTVFFGVHSYVVISPNGLDVDVTAHELTHAELHYRLYDGKIVPKTIIPIWFDEGVATQNDYRERYNENAWLKATDNGKNISDFVKLKSEDQFYNPDVNIRRYNYIISKHEVGEWVKTHSIDKLITLIEDVNAGKSFSEVYDDK